MKFADFLSREVIRVPLQARDKEGVIREMVQVLADAGKLEPEQYERAVTIVLKREELGTSGIGRGVAVPETSCRGVDRLLASFGRSPEGVDFDSLDGEPVYVFFLLLSPPDRPGDTLRALEHISRHLRDDAWLARLRTAETPEETWHLFKEADHTRCNR